MTQIYNQTIELAGPASSVAEFKECFTAIVEEYGWYEDRMEDGGNQLSFATHRRQFSKEAAKLSGKLSDVFIRYEFESSDIAWFGVVLIKGGKLLAWEWGEDPDTLQMPTGLLLSEFESWKHVPDFNDEQDFGIAAE